MTEEVEVVRGRAKRERQERRKASGTRGRASDRVGFSVVEIMQGRPVRKQGNKRLNGKYPANQGT